MADETKKFTVKLEGNTAQFSTSFSSAGKAATDLGAKLGGSTRQLAQWTEAQQRAAQQMSRTHAEALKLNRALDSTRTAGGRLTEAFKSLTTGGGVSGALAAIGPAGVAAAGALGIVTIAGKAAFAQLSGLASKAENWSNIATTTGLGTTQVQQLGSLLEDAGIPTEALSIAMKALHREIADGGTTLAKYGIDLASIKDLSPEEQLQAVAQAIMAISDVNERGAAAQAAFGRSGEQLIPILNAIATGGYKVLDALGDKQFAALKHVDDELDKAGRSWKNFWNGVVGGAARAINALDNFEDRTNKTIRNPVTESMVDFEKRLAREQATITGSSLSLGTETPEQKEAVRAYLEGQKESAKKQDEITGLLAKAADSARSLAFKLMAEAESKIGGPRTYLGIESLPQGRPMPLSAVPGAKNYDFGIDAQGFVTWGEAAKEAGEKTKETAAQTETWSDRLGSLADQLNTLAATTGGLTGKIVGFAASLASGLGGAIQGFQTMKGAGGGLMGFLGKASGALGIVGSAVGVVGSLISGFKSLFGGKSKEQKATEKAAADAAKKQAEEDARQAKITARQNLESGLATAKGFAESLMDTLAKGGLSAGLSTALQTLINKVGGALYKSGLGILDARLKDSKEFQAAQGIAGDVAGLIGGMRQAGVVDTGLLAAGGAAAAEIQAQAIAAAKAAGMTDAEAAKAGSAAIAGLLREQLNASLQSGQELDANTQALLDEAKKNGIEILADPAIEAVDIAKQQLDVLKDIAGQRGGDTSAARGFGPMITPNLGGGLGPRIQTHAGEWAMVIPRSRIGPGGILSAASGLFTNRRGGEDRDREDRERPGAPGGGDGGGGEAAGAAPATPAEVEAAVRRGTRASAPTVNFQNVMTVEANPFQSAESRAEALRIIMEEAANQLDANAGRFAAAIDRRIRARM